MAPPPELAPRLRRLLPTLYIRGHATATGCSKGPQGLLYPLGVAGLCTSTTGSPDRRRGQRGSRSSIHASRQLSGKVLRYLKRVIVTPAVYRRFARLYPGFTYRHWAGVTSRTHPFGLAAGCVFIKQSEPPGHCDLLLRGAGTPSTEDTGPVCRVPSPAFLRHALGFSPRGTSVGSWYGLPGSFPAPFSRAPGLSRSLLTEACSRLHLVLTITVLPRLQRLNRATALLGLARSVGSGACVAARTREVQEY